VIAAQGARSRRSDPAAPRRGRLHGLGMSSTTAAPTTDRLADAHLAALGVRDDTLSPDEAAALDRDGYVVMGGMIDPEWLERLRAAFDGRLKFTLGQIAAEAQASRLLYDLANVDPACDGLWSHPRVLAAVQHILRRPFRLSSLNGRDPVRGDGGQGLHADWADRHVGDRYHVVNSLWLLDDFTPDNGATRLVPGSHLLDSSERLALAVDAPHPREVVLQAPAGTVIVFNAHAWHGGTMNRSGDRRRVMHAYFTAREHRPQLDHRAYVRLATYRRLSEAQRWLMDVE
jgi:ectoine hydroxylase-related dioxygenase (phytanoyl-CoA dioxygenase family)